ncbi:sensor histidine kinase [Sandaracinobacteroides saxicola]|uniref:histidine kinase n=1 Tax=Sandaracinobacteroides saxicola TaxID=2759707 RepID=A0A7G5IJH0_9SPHN|nr:histidine kinase [Sandaracinobacteroides saxicola]QMW23512.1 histidine kinase [Sandaracinobacteroides saxicola]
MTAPDPPTRPSRRLALLSIGGFWLAYFVINTLMMAIYEKPDQLPMAVRRGIVVTVSIGLTSLLWLLLRRFDHLRARRLLPLAFIACVPLALAYSATNYVAFELFPVKWQIDPLLVIQQPPAPPAPPVPPVPPIVTGDENNRIIVKPAPPTPPGATESTRVDQGASSSVTTITRTRPDGSRTTATVITAGEEHESPLQQIVGLALQWYFFIVCWAVMWIALTFAAQVRAAEQRAARYAAAAQSAELRALRYQINPHFLFNTLNSLSSLVMKGANRTAETMILNLSDFFRASLSGDPTDDVPLHAEIALQQRYLAIEAVRFPGRLAVVVDLPAECRDAPVPGFILQPIVENAIKYAVAPVARPVSLTFTASTTARRLRVRVEDDGPGSSTDAGTGLGLRNVRDRLAARYGDDAWLEAGPRPGGGWRVILDIPHG